MQIVKTRYGSIPVGDHITRHADGSIKSCNPVEECLLETRLGLLSPQFTTGDARRKTIQALTFHPNGCIRSISLESRTIIPTPAGPAHAEFLTLHENETLKRIFPLNGKLTGYWTQEDEARLASPMTFPTPLGPLTAKVIGLCFTESGSLRSLTLWPGEIVEVPTPAGRLAARIGLSFGPDGSVSSLEPARPQPVATPAGLIQAYDHDAVGVNGDANSLAFLPNGEVARITTSLTSILTENDKGARRRFSPGVRESLCGDGETEPVPMRVEFEADFVAIQTNPAVPPVRIPRQGTRFMSEPWLLGFSTPMGKARCAI